MAKHSKDKRTVSREERAEMKRERAKGTKLGAGERLILHVSLYGYRRPVERAKSEQGYRKYQSKHYGSSIVVKRSARTITRTEKVYFKDRHALELYLKRVERRVESSERWKSVSMSVQKFEGRITNPYSGKVRGWVSTRKYIDTVNKVKVQEKVDKLLAKRERAAERHKELTGEPGKVIPVDYDSYLRGAFGDAYVDFFDDWDNEEQFDEGSNIE